MEHQECKVTGRKFLVTDLERDLLGRIAGANSFLSEPLPLPAVYPTEVLRRMAPFGNQFYLHRTKSALSGKSQLSRYHPDSSYKVITNDEFWSEEVDNTRFGKPYDFSRPFFEQWNDLMHRCYMLPLLNDRIENCDFANGCFNCKSCYLCFDSTESRDCLYCFVCHRGESNLDCCHSEGCSYCYSCSDITNCYECQHCRDCYHCQNCIACVDCRSSSDCIGCLGLSNARYQILNKQYSREEYLRLSRSLALVSSKGRASLLEKAAELRAAERHAVNTIINCEDSSGSYLKQSKNLYQCYNTINSRDCAFLLGGINSRDCCKGYAFNCELAYTSVNNASYNCNFSYTVSNCSSCWYSYYLFNNCADCFGCVGLKKKSYCVLNYQLSKKEYEELLPRIVAQMKSTGEWAEWFPPQLSPNTYQESWADEYMEEISLAEAGRRGYRLGELESRPAGSYAVDIETLDESAVPADLTGKTIRCAKSGQAFNFQAKELDFYARFGVPLPSIHWRERLKGMLRERARTPDILPEDL